MEKQSLTNNFKHEPKKEQILVLIWKYFFLSRLLVWNLFGDFIVLDPDLALDPELSNLWILIT